MKLFFLCIAYFLLNGCSSLYWVVPDSHEVMFWPQDKRDIGFQAVEDYSEVKTVKAGANIKALPISPSIPSSVDRVVNGFMKRQDIAGLMVLKDGKIVAEQYARGFDENGRWTSFSVAKSITSTLVGAAIKDGYIKSLDDKVTQYIPNLVGSVYDDVSVRQLLT